MENEDVRWLDSNEVDTWLQLWSMVAWLPTRLDAQLREDAGLSLAEYHVLSQISMAPERRIRLSELAEVANITISHLSRVVSRMENAGWVRREPDPTDGRATLGVLTEAGWEKVVATAPGHVATVRRYVFDNLTPEQVRALGDAATEIVAAVAPTRIARV
ncbi:MarR family transcriptional regulator [Gulosibacter chungangensis]|uniref:MarR family transcriptional regulator n=2 Tax=Gulosibacter chungangensis TaxID=979746 RepID=A0A7J5BI44_9MICO|nr:MarR family transcriptional regulator [Gulosibacter chungangensis]